MLLLKSCPKCHGDIVEERDRCGSYTQCIQCGYTRDLLTSKPPVLLQYRDLYEEDKHE